MDSKPIQCRFESDPGHFAFVSKIAKPSASDPLNISVARRASVALMDDHVGPKY